MGFAAGRRVVRFGRVDARDRVEICLSQRCFFPVDPMAEPHTCLKHELGRVFDCDSFRLHLGLQDRWLGAVELLSDPKLEALETRSGSQSAANDATQALKCRFRWSSDHQRLENRAKFGCRSLFFLRAKVSFLSQIVFFGHTLPLLTPRTGWRSRYFAVVSTYS